MPQRRPTLSIYLLSHVPFGKPVSTRRVKPEGMLFRDMLQSMQTAPTALAIEALRVPPMRMTLGRLGAKTSRYASFLKKRRTSRNFAELFALLIWEVAALGLAIPE
jgi:hypothetical protein